MHRHISCHVLRPGDTVQIWSDGPLMTVVGEDSDQRGWLVCCWWSESDRKYLTAAFPPAALEMIPRD